MDKAVNGMPPADEAAGLQAAINETIREIDRLHAQMSRDQAEIERSRARTRAMLSQLTPGRQAA